VVISVIVLHTGPTVSEFHLNWFRLHFFNCHSAHSMW